MPEILKEKAAGLLAELVSCPSVNPGPGRAAGDSDIYGELRYMRMLADKISALGGEVSLTEFDAGRSNIVGRFTGTDRSVTLAFESHGDTVSHDGMTVDPFAATVENGRLYGRGSCDTKASMAAMLLAIEMMAEAGEQPPVDICIISTGDEEISGRGVRALLDSGFRADAVIVGEPTGLDIVHASKGSMRFYIETFGKAAHSSAPDSGVNAIYHMMRVVEAIETQIVPVLAGRSDDLLGAPTISVGVISGGRQVNIVADHCHLEVDRRLIPAESSQQVQDEITCELERLAASVENFNYKMKARSAYPPFSNSPESPLVKSVAKCCNRTLGHATLRTVPWAATSGVFAAAGIPSLLIGPGDIAQAHTIDEYVEIDQVARAAALYADIMRHGNSLGDSNGE